MRKKVVEMTFGEELRTCRSWFFIVSYLTVVCALVVVVQIGSSQGGETLVGNLAFDLFVSGALGIVSFFLFRSYLNENSPRIALVSRFSELSGFLFSPKTQTEVFQPIEADWQEEYFEALFKNEVWKARWINVRYAYAFLAAMWMKSPIDDVIEFVMKVAKK